jgi:enoyl-CoA hydratase/carnithine racemase
MLQWGLADRVVAKGGAIQAALALAEEVCAMPKLPVQIIKQSINDFSLALRAVASHRDAGDMLLCMQDEEGAAARLVALGALEEKKRT